MVKIPDKNYEMGKYPVTVAKYNHFAKHLKKDGKDNHPVTSVSWEDATAYCEWLSEKTGDDYRLPTEKEWEYACRAGTTTKWSFGNDENSDNKTHIVGEKLPNPWGLYDMHGNVWEWCENWYDKNKYKKVLRGGSWGDYAHVARSSSRDWDDPDSRDGISGFRLLRTLPSDLGDF